MSSRASVSTMQCLVEQLKLEASVERIKVSQTAAELQQYCMQNACKDALLLGFQLEAIPSGSPDPALYWEDWEEDRRGSTR